MRVLPALEHIPPGSALFEELSVSNHFRLITQKLTDSSDSSVQSFEDLIPMALRVLPPNVEIDMPSATLYVALHPLFTTQDVLFGRPLHDNSSRIFHITAMSARATIDHFSLLHEDGKILSLWMEAERVIECGTVWLFYLAHQSNSQTTRESDFSRTGMGNTMAPLLKVSSLLSSFSARWKDGAAYVDAWQACVELLWPMLPYNSAGTMIT